MSEETGFDSFMPEVEDDAAEVRHRALEMAIDCCRGCKHDTVLAAAKAFEAYLAGKDAPDV